MYSDGYKTNLFSAIFCVISLVSATSLGIIAICQNYIYSKREKREKENQLVNVKKVIDSIIEENAMIIKSWKISKKKVFNLCETSHYKMTSLLNFEFNIFNAIGLEANLFSIINDYNNNVSVINFNINNYNIAIKENMKKDIEDYKVLIMKCVKSLKRIYNLYKNSFSQI